ncbi:MAG TPA: hypothetical protein VK137_18405, partial [Planctomycetaceae bacterium]|nr:hypothetical protein [Planctomycetaceae bacterium]
MRVDVAAGRCGNTWRESHERLIASSDGELLELVAAKTRLRRDIRFVDERDFTADRDRRGGGAESHLDRDVGRLVIFDAVVSQRL